MRKSFLLIFTVSLLLVACATTQANNSATATPVITASSAVSTILIPTQTSVAKLTPKHNDLIFIEFFAVT